MNFGILLSLIFVVLGASTIVALKSYKNAPEPLESSHGHGPTISESFGVDDSRGFELIVPTPEMEEIAA